MEVPHSKSCDASGEVTDVGHEENRTLQLLEDMFARYSASRADLQTQEQRGRRPEHRQGFEEFQEVLRSITDPDSEASWVERFFHEVDISSRGRVEDYVLQQYGERGHLSVPRDAVLDTEPRITHCTYNKRQPITRVVAVPSPRPLRYIGVSKAGMLTVLNTRLHILKTLQLAGDPAADGSSRKLFQGWTTDAVYMAHVHRVAIATSYNDIRIVDVTTSAISEDIHLYGFSALPTALCYWHDVKHPEQHPLLLWGDEKGGVHLMRFLKPSKIENPFTEDTSTRKIYMPSLLGDIKRLVSYHHIPNIHHEPINRVMYEPYTDLILTSSGSDTSSVVIMDVSRRLKPYIWRIDKGVMCFDYSRALKLVVTGGLDPVVRLWNRYVPGRPSAALEGHLTTVLDVAIYHPVGQIFSYSRDEELRVWDISSHGCLRTLRLQFPCVLPGRHPEHGNFPFLLTPPLPGNTWPHLLVGCKDYLAQLRLAEGTENQDVDSIPCAL